MPFTIKAFDQVTVLSPLVEIIKEMPIVKRHALLEELKKRPPQFKREHRSIVIRSRVEYVVKEIEEKGICRNSGASGVSIETRILLRSFPLDSAPIRIPAYDRSEKNTGG